MNNYNYWLQYVWCVRRSAEGGAGARAGAARRVARPRTLYRPRRPRARPTPPAARQGLCCEAYTYRTLLCCYGVY